ncbi:MAG: hypothetical protein QF569_28465 [Candidatus Poribacteria bacterium]|nr:hypothetical protein [Candidatus Poribacteria bacterium]
MAALESESGESSESKTRPLKFSGSGPAQEQSTEKRLLDSPDSLSPPLTPPKPSPARGLGLGESNPPQTHPHSLNQVQHSPLPEGTVPVAEFHLLENEEDLARRLDDYVKAEVLALDIETTGLDPLTHQIRLVQIAAQGLPVLIVDLFQCPNGLSALTPLLVNESVKVIESCRPF